MGHVTRNLLLANAVLLCQFALFGVVQHNDNVLASFGFEKQRPALARFIIFTVRVTSGLSSLLNGLVVDGLHIV